MIAGQWILDVGLNEDASKSCRGYSAENLAVIRHIGLNLLSRDKKIRSLSKPNDSRLAITTMGIPRKKIIHIKPKNVTAGVARRNIFGFYYFLQVPILRLSFRL
jgi:hypothetical protein